MSRYNWRKRMVCANCPHDVTAHYELADGRTLKCIHCTKDQEHKIEEKTIESAG